jgi:hypothetical protein
MHHLARRTSGAAGVLLLELVERQEAERSEAVVGRDDDEVAGLDQVLRVVETELPVVAERVTTSVNLLKRVQPE